MSGRPPHCEGFGVPIRELLGVIAASRWLPTLLILGIPALCVDGARALLAAFVGLGLLILAVFLILLALIMLPLRMIMRVVGLGAGAVGPGKKGKLPWPADGLFDGVQ